MPNSKTQSRLDYISNFMKYFETNLTKIEFAFRNENNHLNKIVNVDQENLTNLIQDCLNKERKNLIKKLKSIRDSQLKLFSSTQSVHSKLLTIFIPSKLAFSSIELIGHLKQNPHRLSNRIKNLHLQQKFICHTYQASNIDHVILLGAEKIVHFDLGLIKIFNPSNGNIFNQTQICLTPPKKRFQYCRAAHNSILAFFELDYEKDYVLEIYDLMNLKLKSSRSFKFYVDNFCSNENEIISWSPNNSPYLSIYDYNLNEIKAPSFDSIIFDTFYSLSDFKENLILFHSQNLIGVVSRETGKLVKEINMN